MKYYELDKEEKRILKDYEDGKFVSVRNLEQEKQKLQRAARFTLSKTKNINIRISERDLQKIKVQAIELGIPYQTLVSSIIHQHSNGKIRTFA